MELVLVKVVGLASLRVSADLKILYGSVLKTLLYLPVLVLI